MPTYRYRSKDESIDCDTCTEGFEVMQAISEAPLASCPSCDVPIRRVIGRIQALTNRRWNTKKMLSDGNLKRLGFKKMVKQSNGKYIDALRQD